MTERQATSLAVALLAVSSAAAAQMPLAAPWNEGSKNCKANPQPPIEVRAIDAHTYVLRENLCATFEAPFMYLLVGKTRALLIDTGDVADPGAMPLAHTVMTLLAGEGSPPLLVVHTHRHLDHRAGDAQFARLPGVEVVGYDLESVKRHYGFANWPEGVAHIDLGDRTVDVIPTPGHNATHVSFYDRVAGLFFSGDFLLPGRLLVDDAAAERASARRAAAFVRDLPVTTVLGGHIEENAAGQTFDWGSQYHPNERALPMTKADLVALPAAAARFNGFYTEAGKFTFMDSMRLLAAAGFVTVALLLAVAAGTVFLLRRRGGRA